VNAKATALRTNGEQLHPVRVEIRGGSAAQKLGTGDADARRPRQRFRLRAIAYVENWKMESLRLWLCSSRRGLRESQQRGRIAPSQPVMRSPLPQFQTPAPPRRVRRLFRSVALQVALPGRSLSLLRTGKVYLASPFSRRRRTS
jgi:hypothetical protein